jgi:hypothetical protein
MKGTKERTDEPSRFVDLRERFVHPCKVESGVYQTPQEVGASCDLKLD